MEGSSPATVDDFRAQVEAERSAVQRHFDTLGADLAKALNDAQVVEGGWTYSVSRLHSGGLTLHHQGHGLGILVWRAKSYLKGAAGRRLTVEGRYSSEYCGWRATPITVSMDRPVSAMARDVARRFLPGYLATVDASLEAARKAEEAKQARRGFNRRIAEVVPGVRAMGGYDPAQAPDRTRSYWSTPTYDEQSTALAGGRITIASDGSRAGIVLESVTQDLALRVLALVNPRRVLQGTIAPRPIAPVRLELPAVRTVVGEVVRTGSIE